MQLSMRAQLTGRVGAVGSPAIVLFPALPRHVHQEQCPVSGRPVQAVTACLSAIAPSQPQGPTAPQAAEQNLDTNVQKAAAELGLHLPNARHQRALTMTAITLLRTEVNTAAREKQLQNITVGQKGITATFLAACMDLLAKHRFLRVRVGEGGKKQEALAALLAALLDSVCVFQIGSTVTLFRQGGLPRPSNCPQNHDLPPELVSQSPSADAAFGAMGAMKGGKAERRIAQLARRAAGQAAHAARRAPPEFHTA